VKEILSHVHLKPFEGASSVIIIDSAELMSEEAANALLKTLEEPPPQVLILLLTADEEAILPTIRSRCRRLPLLPLAKDQLTGVLTTQHQASPEDAELVSRLARGCLGWAIGALEPGSAGLEERGDRLAKLMETCRSGLETRFNYANELAGLFYKDRDAVKQWLYFWLRWWRDLLLIKEGGEEYIHNTDRGTELRLQATQLTTAEVVGFIKMLLETLEALGRNASARLALEVLMLNLPTTTAAA
jgi:DNA polymerase-3 subunit delta'